MESKNFIFEDKDLKRDEIMIETNCFNCSDMIVYSFDNLDKYHGKHLYHLICGICKSDNTYEINNTVGLKIVGKNAKYEFYLF